MSDLFDFTTTTDPYAVMGNPIQHSKSPTIHQAFAHQTEQSLTYDAIQVDLGGFPQATGNFFANGGKGINVTVPFKQEAWHLVDTRSDRAEIAGAVNTIIPYNNGKLLGENTDGLGLIQDLSNNKISLKNKIVLLIGAGGAARGVIKPLIDSGTASITIVNRTVSKAQQLAARFSQYGDIQGAGFDGLDGQMFDIIINATSASLHGELPPVSPNIIGDHCSCYDMMYSAQPTCFVTWAKQHHVSMALDGLGMLVEQAAESFRLWRGIMPETASVIQLIRDQLKASV